MPSSRAVHDRHRDPQHAAGGPRLGPDRVHDDGRRPGRLHRRERPDDGDLHQPEEPADRGLRLRSVRLSGREQMTDRPTRPDRRPTDRRARSARSSIGRRRRPARPAGGRTAPREHARPRASARSRTTCCGWAASSRSRSGAAIRPSSSTTPSCARRSSRATRRINEAQRARRRALITRDHRHPAAGRPRPALPADAGPRRPTSSSGWATTPASVAKQARKLAPAAAARGLRATCPEMGRARRAAGPRRAARAGRRRRGRRRAQVAARDDEVDELYHAHLRRGARADAGRPGQRRSRARGSCSPRTTSSGSATGSRTSPRTSSSWPRGEIEDLNP